MKLKDLIKDLQTKDDELDVIYASDDEGNSYHPVCFHSSEGYLVDGIFIRLEDADELTKDTKDLICCIN